MGNNIEEQKAKLELDKEYDKLLNSSWKDEFITILVTLPLILPFIFSFIYPDKFTMDKAFEVLKNIPEYYQTIVFIVVLMALGLRSMVDKFVDKMVK